MYQHFFFFFNSFNFYRNNATDYQQKNHTHKKLSADWNKISFSVLFLLITSAMVLIKTMTIPNSKIFPYVSLSSELT